MSVGTIAELVVAGALIVVAVLQFRKRAVDGSRRGSQAALLLFAIAIIVILHALGAFAS